jgi:hypothetical protein
MCIFECKFFKVISFKHLRSYFYFSKASAISFALASSSLRFFSANAKASLASSSAFFFASSYFYFSKAAAISFAFASSS